MNRSTLLLAALAAPAFVSAQKAPARVSAPRAPALGSAQKAPEDAAALEKKLADKLAEPWVTKAPWITDLELAKKKASETGHPILAYFSRSYAP